MTTILPDPGSFKDPSGRVYIGENRVFRTVTDHAAQSFEYVTSTGLLDELTAAGLVVGWSHADGDILGLNSGHVRYVIEHPRLPFITYPYEWSFRALKAAALLYLDIHLQALERDVTLSDASAYNVQFTGARPIFIDLLSFRRYTDGEFWAGYKQFCEHFLNPLLLRAIVGVPHNAWYRGSLEGIGAREISRTLPLRVKLSPKILMHVVLQASLQNSLSGKTDALVSDVVKGASFPRQKFVRLLNNLRAWVRSLEPKDVGRSTWESYARTNTYTDSESDAKRRFVREFIESERPGMVWDFGCNVGEYAEVALGAGAEHVVGFEYDHRTLELAFDRAQKESTNFLPLYLDAANPSPSQGWAQAERRGLCERGPSDAILALAFIHHVVIGCNVPLESAVDWLISCGQTGVIEFVPKADKMVQQMLRLREDIFTNYDEDAFLRYIEVRARIVKRETISSTGRILAWYSKA